MQSMRDFADRGYGKRPVAEVRKSRAADLLEAVALGVVCWAVAVTMIICLLRGN